ncbi:MAG: hypothetical protein ACR2NG_01555 [Acidimicrobiia bacterium]
MRRLTLLTAALMLVVAACSTDTIDTGTTPGTGLPESPERCEVVDQQVLDYLQTGITVDDLELVWGFSVQSTDYPDVWIVAAGVQGPNDEDFATWAVRAGNWPTEYVGVVSVDEIAMTISSWGEQVDVIVTPATSGVKSAEACAIARLETGA